MKPTRKPLRQFTSQEVRDELLRFIQTKFYQGHPVAFAKDRRRLLDWVVLKFAAYLDERGVTIHESRYLEIMRDQILMDALRFGDTGNITYLPAWLGKVVDSHLAHHGEKYYEEGKSLRHRLDNALAFARKAVQAAPRDPVRELAQASCLLKAKKAPVKPTNNGQLNLFK